MMKAFNQVGTLTPDNLIAGNQIPLLTKAIELAPGAVVLKRGSVISVDGTLANSVTTGVAPDTITVYDSVEGILTDDVTLDEEVATYATVYISGEFNATFMTAGEDAQALEFERELRTLGIYIK